jgi:hypothetical protein
MNLFDRKPGSLAEVVRRVRGGEQKFDPSLREFLDSFYANPGSRQQALEERPISIDALHDAYVAAVAEHLARAYEIPIPEWSEIHGNGLREPFFSGGLQSLKGVLTAESPTAAPPVRKQRRTIEAENVIYLCLRLAGPPSPAHIPAESGTRGFPSASRRARRAAKCGGPCRNRRADRRLRGPVRLNLP